VLHAPSNRLTCTALTALAAALLATLAAAPAAQAAATCADDARFAGGVHPGGDWRFYGKDLQNTRHQDRETRIGRAEARRLAPLWTFSSVKAGGSGDFTGPPVVADGCVFAGSNGGWVFALNADTGQRVWRAKFKGIISNAVAVPGDGRVYVGVTNVTDDPCAGPGCDGPYVVALDQRTGREVWRTNGPIDAQPGSDLYGSPIFFDPYGAATSAAGGAAPRRCTSRRSFRIRLGRRVRSGDRLVSARVYVNGKRVRTLRGRRLRARVDLRGLPKGRAVVTVVGRTRKGRTLRERRVYRTCVPRRTARRGETRARAAQERPGPVLITGVSGWAAEDDVAGKVRYDWKGSIVVLDARTGEVLRKIWTIGPPGDGTAFAGGSVWSTPSIDERAKVAYVSTSNTFSYPETEHPNTNAILKIGLDRADPATFGRILAAGKGTPDEYYTDYTGTPCRADLPPGAPRPPLAPGLPSEPACFDLDLAFGASPNLVRGKDGRLLVGAGQKSGVYHMFDAASMKRVWKTELGPPSLIGGIVGATAYDGKGIYGPTTVPAQLWSVDPESGARRWQFPMPGPANYGNMVAVANGVAYTTNGNGYLSARDTDTGATLLDVPVMPGQQTQSGTTVARNTVYAAIGSQGAREGFIVAFRPDAKPMPPQAEEPPAPEEQQQEQGGSTSAPGPTIFAGPGAQTTGYVTPVMSTRKGGPLNFANGDVAQHDVTAAKLGPDGLPLFRSRRVNNQELAAVEGLDRTEPGTYEFFCSLHPGMKGTLQVTP
jgi:outer membrane protein assembly factor BamB/plastocyanin